jgi:hypothetical protein
MQTSVAAGAVEYGSFEIVEDDFAAAATDEVQGVHQRTVELGVALR